MADETPETEEPETDENVTDATADQAVDAAKAERLGKVKFPVKNLTVTTDGVMLNGLPLEQASLAEQLRLSVALGFALNPKLRVILVRDGSLLDDDNLDLVGQMAHDAGGQCWVETVSSDGEGCAVLFEDGVGREIVAEDAPPPPTSEDLFNG
jgi:hypothetical protein